MAVMGPWWPSYASLMPALLLDRNDTICMTAHQCARTSIYIYIYLHIKSEDTENTHTNLYGMPCKQSKKMWHTQISHANKQIIITNNSYTALFSNTCVKLTALYKQLDQNHIYIHFNKPDHSCHIYTPTHTQSIGTVTHGLPRPVQRPVQRMKS